MKIQLKEVNLRTKLKRFIDLYNILKVNINLDNFYIILF